MVINMFLIIFLSLIMTMIVYLCFQPLEIHTKSALIRGLFISRIPENFFNKLVSNNSEFTY